MSKHLVGLMHELILPFNCFNYRASLEVVAKLEESEDASNQAQEKRDRMTAPLLIIFINQNHSVKCNKSIELRLNADRNQNYHIRKGYQGLQSWRQVASTAFPQLPRIFTSTAFPSNCSDFFNNKNIGGYDRYNICDEVFPVVFKKVQPPDCQSQPPESYIS